MFDLSSRGDPTRPSSGTSRQRGGRGQHRCFDVSRPLEESEARFALLNFYNVAVRIAHVAARLAALVHWLV